MRDIIKKLPKLRGYRFNSPSKKSSVVNVGALNIFEAGTSITPSVLFEKNLVRRMGGVMPSVKILGNGEIAIKVEISGCEVSKIAREKIEKAGGSVK
jgi:large subunit ribosomal protein L15